MPFQRSFGDALERFLGSFPQPVADAVFDHFLEGQAGTDIVRAAAPDILDIALVIDLKSVFGVEQREPVCHDVDRLKETLMRLAAKGLRSLILYARLNAFGHVTDHNQPCG